MERTDGTLILSATDLVGHLACSHLTRLSLDGLVDGKPTQVTDEHDGDGGDVELLQRLGLDHEARHLEALKQQGLEVSEIADIGSGPRLATLEEREAETLAAMAAGADVVFQATFIHAADGVAWRGHADFLTKVDGHCTLGAHHYEPEDTKLARKVKPSAVLQLCEYAEHLERLQGRAPDRIHVVLGDGMRASLRLAEFAAYHRVAKAAYLRALGADTETYPLPVAHCAVCRWNEACEQRREADDHLCRVALLTREQARKLTAVGVPTLTALAQSGDDLAVKGIGKHTLDRLRRQARLQLQRVDGEPPPYELLEPVDAGLGLAALPEPDPGDLFYDIEGDPHVGDDGLEYLHGLGWMDNGAFRFEALWAHDAAQERQVFEALVDRIVERRRAHPGMHVYHYAPYEVTALGRLMGRYGTREDELDDLLRDGVFVDLYRVVRQGVAVGSPSYSIKKLEPLYMEARTGEVTDAGSSIVEYERWLREGNQQILDDIEAYNRDDVESTALLRDWLEERRRELVDSGVAVPRPPDDGEIDDAEATRRTERAEADAAIDALIDQLLDGLDPDADDGNDPRRLMAHLLRWHEREAKPEWWKYFDRVLHSDDDDLYEDTEAIAGLQVVGEPVPDKRSLIWTYRFDPDQEYKLRRGDSVLDPAVERQKLDGVEAPGPGTLWDLDAATGELQLRRGQSSAAEHPSALIPGGPINDKVLRESLQRVARAIVDHGTDGAGSIEAGRRLLSARPPRIAGVGEGEPLRHKDETTLDAAMRLARGLDRSHLPIQGPPGAGKSYTAAHIIRALVADGHVVGITANSHSVVANLLDEVMKQADDADQQIRAMRKVSSKEEDDGPVELVSDNQPIEEALAEGTVDVVAGTPWLFAREQVAGRLHTLVIDEAGQMSLANVLAVAPAADNLILVGDPRQLPQPSTGTHPPGADASALEHVLGGNATIPDHLGLFLDTTWRMHPDVCTFISEQVYEGRLEPEEHCAAQTIHDGPLVAGSGLRWVPVEHTDNRTSSEEEAVALDAVYRALLGRTWTQADGAEATIGLEDLLVVAPYNAQVHLLAEHLPEGARIGTVDKYQGQQGAVVLISLAASSADDIPRGMEFLYSRNRLNVAVSRAKAMAVLVASPTLLTVRCRTVEQMRLANVLCRYVELAEGTR